MVGGVETQLDVLLTGLRDCDLFVLTQHALAGRWEPLASQVLSLEDYGCTRPYSIDLANLLRYGRAVARVQRVVRADVVIGMTHTGALAVALSRMLGGGRCCRVGTMFGHLSGYFARIGRPPARVERWLLRFCAGLCDGFVVPSQAVADDLVRHFAFPRGKVRVIFNGVDVRQLQTEAEAAPPLAKTLPWVVTASRLAPEKDFETLLTAFARLRERTPARLLIAGEGELRETILARALELGVADDVVLTGFLVNPHALIARADVFVLASHHEGFGNVIVEALALGVPVVASDAPGGPREILRGGADGILVTPGDPVAMADAVSAILNDNVLAQRLAHRGRERVEAFSARAMTEGYLDYFRCLMARRERALRP